MQTHRARMGENGRIVLPVELRKAMDLQGGQELMLTLDDDGLHIQTFRQSVARAQAMVREFVEPGRSLAEELIAERRQEAKFEEERWSKS